MAFGEGKPPTSEASISSEIVRRLNEYSRRIRDLEQRLDEIKNRSDTIEETILNQLGDLKLSLERVSQKIPSISDRLVTIENEVLRLNKDLDRTALKSDVKRIETFIDVVNPVTAKFVTRDELERALEERVKRKA